MQKCCQINAFIMKKFVQKILFCFFTTYLHSSTLKSEKQSIFYDSWNKEIKIKSITFESVGASALVVTPLESGSTQ